MNYTILQIDFFIRKDEICAEQEGYTHLVMQLEGDNQLQLKTVGYNDKYLINTIIGSGTFGRVYSAKDTKHHRYVAVKIENRNIQSSQLIHEGSIYRQLNRNATENSYLPMPRMYYCATENNYNVLVMQQMGPSLSNLFVKRGNKFPLKTVLYLAQQMISICEFIHSKGVVHRDIKPSNFCLRSYSKSEVCLIDFGLARKFLSSDNIHISEQKIACFVGNYLYGSINSMQLLQSTRRDDLESLGYVLIHFAKGFLPWQSTGEEEDTMEASATLQEKKINTSIDELCSNLSLEFALYMRCVRDLQFDEQPNYQFLRNLFRLAFRNKRFSKRHYDLY